MKLRFLFGYNTFIKFYLMSFSNTHHTAWSSILHTQYDSVQELYYPVMMEWEAINYLERIKQL